MSSNNVLLLVTILLSGAILYSISRLRELNQRMHQLEHSMASFATTLDVYELVDEKLPRSKNEAQDEPADGGEREGPEPTAPVPEATD